MSWRAFAHHTLKTLLRVVQVATFIVVPAILIWLQTAGLPHTFYPQLTDAAARQGLQLDFSRMRLSLLEGLVLDDVRLRAIHLPQNNEVGVDRTAVSLNWRSLLQGKVELTSLDLRGAQLFLPIASEGGVIRAIRLTKARARLMLSDGVISVPLARFNLQGVDVVASGQIILESKEEPQPSPTFSIPPEASRVLEILEGVHFGETAPLLELEFAAKSGNASALQVPRLHFDARQATRGKIALRDIQLEASYREGALTVDKLSARDAKWGRLDVSGTWNFKTGEARGAAGSSLDLAPWLAEFAPDGPWGDAQFNDPPSVEATLEINPLELPRVRVIGTASAGPFRLRGIALDGISGGFAWRDGEFYANDIAIGVGGGEIRADVMRRPGDARLRVDCNADPLPLVALLDGKTREGIGKMELAFAETPSIQFEATGPDFKPANLKARGKLKLGKTSIHGSPMDNATADVAFSGLALTFSNIRIKRPEGEGSGTFIYDFGRKQVRLDGIRSTMNPFNVLQWADPKVAKETDPYRFKAPPEVTVGGTIGLDDATSTRIWANFTAPQGLDYDLLERTLNFGTATGSIEFTGRKIRVDVPAAKLYGGRVKLTADIITGQPGARQQMDVTIDAVDFEKLTRLYFDYKDSQGMVSGNYKFSFVGGKPREMRGSGKLLVENGNVFAIPVLGPLSAVLNSIIPGAGYQTARRATCDYTVSNGEIRTDNLDVVGQGFSMIGHGLLFYVDDRMDFSVRINAQGVPGLLLYPVSKLFEYVSDGKLSEPEWHPRILPKGGNGKKPDKSADEKPAGR